MIYIYTHNKHISIIPRRYKYYMRDLCWEDPLGGASASEMFTIFAEDWAGNIGKPVRLMKDCNGLHRCFREVGRNHGVRWLVDLHPFLKPSRSVCFSAQRGFCQGHLQSVTSCEENWDKTLWISGSTDSTRKLLSCLQFWSIITSPSGAWCSHGVASAWRRA